MIYINFLKNDLYQFLSKYESKCEIMQNIIMFTLR